MGLTLILAMFVAVTLPPPSDAQSATSQSHVLGLLFLLGLPARSAPPPPVEKVGKKVEKKSADVTKGNAKVTRREARQFRLTYDDLNGRMVVRSVESSDGPPAKPN